MTYLIINFPCDPRWASIVVTPGTGENMVFDTREEANNYAQRTTIHEWIIVELTETKGGTKYDA